MAPQRRSRPSSSRGTSRPAPAKRKGLSVKTYAGLNEKRMKSGGGGGMRVIIKQGDTVPVQFLQTPKQFVEFDQHQWREDGVWNYVPCAGDDCPICEHEDQTRAKRHYKFIANVYDLKEKRVAILEGPKTLATQIFYRYQRKPALFLKRVFDVTKFPTQPVTYGFQMAEENPVRTSGLKLIDLDGYVQGELDRYFGDNDSMAKSSKKGRSALDDEDFEDEDEIEDEDDEFEDEDDLDDDEEDGEEEEPEEDEMLDKDAWPWPDLKAYAKEVGVKTDTRDRAKLVRLIIRKRG